MPFPSLSAFTCLSLCVSVRLSVCTDGTCPKGWLARQHVVCVGTSRHVYTGWSSPQLSERSLCRLVVPTITTTNTALWLVLICIVAATGCLLCIRGAIVATTSRRDDRSDWLSVSLSLSVQCLLYSALCTYYWHLADVMWQCLFNGFLWFLLASMCESLHVGHS